MKQTSWVKQAKFTITSKQCKAFSTWAIFLKPMSRIYKIKKKEIVIVKKVIETENQRRREKERKKKMNIVPRKLFILIKHVAYFTPMCKKS